jgi:hypothetical protein
MNSHQLLEDDAMEENEVQGSDDEGIKKRRGNCGDGDDRMRPSGGMRQVEQGWGAEISAKSDSVTLPTSGQPPVSIIVRLFLF